MVVSPESTRTHGRLGFVANRGNTDNDQLLYDAEAIVRAVEGIAAFADQYRNEIEELDINPLLALPDRAVAVDALIKLRATPEFLTTLTSRST